MRELGSDPHNGLTQKQAAERLVTYGKNELQEERGKSMLRTFLEQLQDPLIYVLIAAAAISFCMKEISDAVIIVTVIVMNAMVGMVQEGKARKALESLKRLTSPHAVVIREGKHDEIPASMLVPGDLVCLDAGCLVPADLRLITTASLTAEESSLTGESLPAEKDAQLLVADRTALGDHRNMAYMSTLITAGHGMGIVTATGMNTQIGRIAGLICESKEEVTPLQRKLGELGKVLSFLSVGLCAALFGIAVLQHRDILKMLFTAISLAVAAVPEGLPAVVTICLALSVTRMVKVNTIIRRLPCVETLGAVSVICSDKTGTLTQNKMTVECCYTDGRESRADTMGKCEELLRGITLCNDAVWEGHSGIGDPTELALLELSAGYGIEKTRLEEKWPRIDEISFDSRRKMMTTAHRTENGRICYTKGAPERVLECCDSYLRQEKIVPLDRSERRKLLAEVQKMSGQALRTIALAVKREEKSSVLTEENLTFVGMVGMKDPPRPEALEAIRLFRRAGVETVMITGDHVDTACAIGKQLGIVHSEEQCMTGEQLDSCSAEELQERLEQVRVFARVSPAQKVELVKGFQKRGEIVAMTGDGVNDAPSLRAADIGIAMGKCGTDVAKQASDMILTDDHFATIEKAMEEGRSVYENIRKSVIFLLSSNLGEILTMFAAVLCGLASPLRSAHILWINLITDSLPALALGVDSNDTAGLMCYPPRKAEEGLFARGGLACTLFYGILIAAISLTAFLMLPLGILRSTGQTVQLEHIRLLLEEPAVLCRAQTYAFTVLGMSQLFHAVGMRDTQKSIFRMRLWDNKLMITAGAAGLLLQLAVTEFPVLIEAFGTAHLEMREWMLLVVLAMIPLLAHEIAVLVGGRAVGG